MITVITLVLDTRLVSKARLSTVITRSPGHRHKGQGQSLCQHVWLLTDCSLPGSQGLGQCEELRAKPEELEIELSGDGGD